RFRGQRGHRRTGRAPDHCRTRRVGLRFRSVLGYGCCALGPRGTVRNHYRPAGGSRLAPSPGRPAGPGGRQRGPAGEVGRAAAWRTVRTLPKPVAAALFAAGADLAVRRRGTGTARLAANLRRVVGPGLPEPEFQVLLRRAMRSYARYWLEAFRLPSLTHEQIM